MRKFYDFSGLESGGLDSTLVKPTKASFGFLKNNLDVIKRHVSKYEGAEYDYTTWKEIGKEINWDPLTACLWYFRLLKTLQ